MTVNEFLKYFATWLFGAGVTTARLDTLILLEDELSLTRAQILAEPDRQITSVSLDNLKKLLDRRVRHEPLAYIRGHAEFYGHDFVLTPDVLVPRPESETMIDLLLELNSGTKNPKIADIGTGSGALGISAKIALPESQVTLIDIDQKALDVARRNVDLLTTNVTLQASDLLTDIGNSYDILLCNLPYVPDEYAINEAAKHEPTLALFGGQDGLDLYRKLFVQIVNRTQKPLYILTESLLTQHDLLTKIAESSEYKLVRSQDLILVFERMA